MGVCFVFLDSFSKDLLASTFLAFLSDLVLESGSFEGVLLAAVDLEAPKTGVGTGVDFLASWAVETLETCELSIAVLVVGTAVAPETSDLAVFARLVDFSGDFTVLAGTGAGSSSESLLSPLSLVPLSALSSPTGCFRFRLPLAVVAGSAFFVSVAMTETGRAGAFVISSSESLSEEESESNSATGLLFAGALEAGLAFVTETEAGVAVGIPIGVNRGFRFLGCSRAAFVFRTYWSVAVELILLPPPNSAMRRRWMVESMARLTALLVS
jgi:hypothetical protein